MNPIRGRCGPRSAPCNYCTRQQRLLPGWGEGGRWGEQTGSSHPPEPARGCGRLSRPGAASPAEVGGPRPLLSAGWPHVIRHAVWSVSCSRPGLGARRIRGGGGAASPGKVPQQGSSRSATSILRGKSVRLGTAGAGADLLPIPPEPRGSEDLRLVPPPPRPRLPRWLPARGSPAFSGIFYSRGWQPSAPSNSWFGK